MNVGAVVALPQIGYLDFETYAPKTRLEQLDRTYEPRKLDTFIDLFTDELEEYRELLAQAAKTGKDAVERELSEIVRTHSGSGFQLTPFKWADFDVDEPESIHMDYFLSDLIEGYVKPVTGKKKRKRRELTLRQQFKKDIKSLGLLARNDKPGISSRYKPLDSIEYEFDYGFSNGSIHLIELVDLSDYEAEESGVLREAGESLIKFIGASALEEFGYDVDRYTILKLSVERDRFPTLRTLEKNSNVYDYENENERKQLLEKIEEAITGSPNIFPNTEPA